MVVSVYLEAPASLGKILNKFGPLLQSTFSVRKSRNVG